VATRELELREQQIYAQQQHAANSYEYSKLALNAQVAEREAHRTAQRSERRERMIFSLVGASFLAAFLIICMRMGRDQIATDAIKNLGALTSKLFCLTRGTWRRLIS
jgi:hypothetical protein